MRARWYDSTTGRFLSHDPAGNSTSGAFGYASGNPLHMIDPSGASAVTDDIPEGGKCSDVQSCIGGTPSADLASDLKSYWLLTSDPVPVVLQPGATIADPVVAMAGLGIVFAKVPKAAEVPTEGDLRGKDPGDIHGPPGSVEKPTKDGTGRRIFLPGRGDSDVVRVMPGSPKDPDPVKQGPYARISVGGKVSNPIPLKGNKTLP
jgi:hypothetical protein